MELLTGLIDFILHIDVHLREIVANYGLWTYAVLFLIIFCETGLVVTPFLPGDSLLFAAGALAATTSLNVWVLWGLLFVAAVVGDASNYFIGNKLGPRLCANENSRILKKSYLDKTHAFCEKHGKKTIVLARFVPIVRTFAPFVVGAGSMRYRDFFAYNVIGGALWVTLFVWAGYFFGNMPVVEHNFTLVIIAIVAISVLPGVVEYARARLGSRGEPATEKA